MIALCPGSFDPVHHGHLEIIARAAELFDEVIVGVAHNSAKKYRFSLEERVRLVEESLLELGIEGVSVEPIPPGVLLAEYAAERGAKVLVKGLRSATDYSYEAPMASMNRHLARVETTLCAPTRHARHAHRQGPGRVTRTVDRALKSPSSSPDRPSKCRAAPP